MDTIQNSFIAYIEIRHLELILTGIAFLVGFVGWQIFLLKVKQGENEAKDKINRFIKKKEAPRINSGRKSNHTPSKENFLVLFVSACFAGLFNIFDEISKIEWKTGDGGDFGDSDGGDGGGD